MYNVDEIKNLGLKDIHLGAEPTNLGLYAMYLLAAVAAVAVLVFLLVRIIPVLKDVLRLTKMFFKSSSFVADMNRLMKESCGRYFPKEKYASLSGKKWIEFLDRTGICNFSGIVDDWDALLYSNHILTKQERRRLYRHGLLWLCSNLWRFA
jgi:hypothetical protein